MITHDLNQKLCFNIYTLTVNMCEKFVLDLGS